MSRINGRHLNHTNPTTMDAYVITGPESLIHAAFKETFEALGKGALLENTGVGPYNSLFFNCAGSYWLSVGLNNLNFQHHLTLPADWGKLMGILTELKKPKLPEYVRGTKSRVYKVKEASEEGLWVYDCYGKVGHLAAEKTTASITEQEFINGGLEELADAGYVKGAKYNITIGKPRPINDLFTVEYMKNLNCSSSSVNEEMARVGFCFVVRSNWLATPAAKCTIIPGLPTTTQGIPYVIAEHQVYVGGTEPGGQPMTIVQLNRRTLAYLLRQGVTDLDTKAGRLTQADLELLTK